MTHLVVTPELQHGDQGAQMKISIELDGATVRLLLAFGLAILGCPEVFGHEVAAALAALLDT
jgi:hypothetical protein